MARIAALLVLVALAACSYDLDALRPDGGGGGMDGRPPPVDGPIADVPRDLGVCTVPADCDDGDMCNGVETCEGGACQPGAATSCVDSDPCTIDDCNPDDGICSFPAEMDGTSCGPGANLCCAGTCVDTSTTTTACGPSCMMCGSNQSCVGGGCTCDPGFNDCDSDPTDCESDYLTDEDNCGSCGTMCGSSESCIDGGCGTCSGDGDCNDMLFCTTDTCTGGTCRNDITSGCLIAGVCYSPGDDNPSNTCQRCTPAMNETAWSNRTGSCNDGLFCTDPDTCSGGTCSGSPRVCSDMLACTSDPCNEAMDRCDTVIMAGNCRIGGACYSGGTPNPANPCQVCNPASPMVWSSNEGAGCNDGVFCNGPDVCRTSACVNVAPTNPCGSEMCDEGGDTCRLCGARNQPCCAGGCDNMAQDVCCADGYCHQCCVHGDCDPINYCPGGGSRWECIGYSCCFGACDSAC